MTNDALHERIEAEIEDFIKSLNILVAGFAARVEVLFHSTEVWEALGAINQLPSMRLQTGRPVRSKTMEPLARSSSSHSRAQKGPKGYWAKMNKAQRSAEMRRRMRKWTPEAKKKWGRRIK